MVKQLALDEDVQTILTTTKAGQKMCIRDRRILFVPTGALLSTVSFNEGKTVPGIAHGVVIEHAD